MIPLLLLASASGVAAVAIILIFWRYADRRIKDAYPDETPEALKKRLDEALDQQALLTARVEHLEAIVASEAWEALSREETPRPAPEEASDAASEENTRRPSQRQQSR